jgi:hypothetical protein
MKLILTKQQGVGYNLVSKFLNSPIVAFPDLNKSNTSYWSHMHTCWSNKNKYIHYGLSIQQKQDKCI